MSDPEQYISQELMHRIGTFFLLLAIGLLVYFLLADSAGAPALQYFCWSMILAILAFAFRAQYRKPSSASGRFEWLKRLLKGKEEE
ncbi:MAG: hypothetical protein OZ914_03190 [Anaerolineaceae bacterium]|nr:hypothetical protein [Anaerolineaceae bacterium]